VAKPKLQAQTRPDPAEAAAKIERPAIKWKIVAQIGGALVILWVTAAMTRAFIGIWGLVVMAVVTAVTIGFGGYVWWLTRKQQRIVDILKQATDPAGRKAAIEQLSAQGGGDAMNALARSQLVAQDDPVEAMRVLESIDLKKAPGGVQDEVRANLAFLYLMQNRPKDARTLVDDLRLDRQSNSKAKAMYAAVMAESFSRTGKADEAKKLLETYKDEDPEYGEVRTLLLRAQIFTFFATKNRGLARRAMEKLAEVDVNQLGPFMQKTTPLEMQKLAGEVVRGSGLVPKQKIKMMR